MMNRLLPALAAALILPAVAGAQSVTEYLEGMTVRHVGQGTMSGRVTAIAVQRDRPEVIYAGTASGGLWRSESAGATW